MVGEPINLYLRPRNLELLLAKPSGKVIAELNEAFNRRHTLKLGQTNEISFDIPMEISLFGVQKPNPNTQKIRERYLVKAICGDFSEWYMIDEIKDNTADDSKQVAAFALQYELKDKIIRDYKTGDYENGEFIPKAYKASKALEDALSETLWSVGYIDSAFELSYRLFDVSSKTALDFVYEIAESFNAIAVFDTEDRTVSLKAPDSIGADRGLAIGYGKYLKTLERTSNADEMATRLKIYGKDGLSINEVNPSGTNYIEDFSFFLYPFKRDANKVTIQSSHYMSDELCHAILDYQELLASKKGQFSGLLTQRDSKNTELKAKLAEWQTLKDKYDQIFISNEVQRAMDVYQAYVLPYSNGTPSGITTSLRGRTRSDDAGNTDGFEYKYALMAKATNVAGLTFKVDGVTKSLNTNWSVISKLNAVQDPVVPPSVVVGTDGSFAAGDIWIKYTWFDGIRETKPSPATKVTIPQNGSFTLTLPSLPSGSNMMARIYMSTRKDDERLQGASSAVVYNYATGSVNANGQSLPQENTFVKSVISLSGSVSSNVSIVYAGITDTEFSAAGNEQSLIDKYSLDNIKSQMDAKLAEIGVIETAIDGIDDQIASLRDEIAIENNFTPELIKDRVRFIIEKEWSDSNYTVAQDLYDDGLKKFEEIRAPKTVLSMDIVNFLQIVECQRDWDKLVLGDKISILHERFDIEYNAKIIEVDLYYDEDNINLTIANVKEIETDEEKLTKMLYKSISSSTTLDLNKFKWDGIDATKSQVDQLINNKWDAVKREIEAGVNESISISQRGLIAKDPTDPDRYLVLQHGVLAITGDGGNTWKHAITSDGIVGERIFGKLIAGVNLMIDASDSSGTKTFTVDANGIDINGSALRIRGGMNGIALDPQTGISVIKSDNKFRALMSATDGFRLQAYELGSWVDKFSADQAGRLVAEDLVANKLIIKNGNTTMIDGNTMTLNLDGFVIKNGKLGSDNLEVKGLVVKNALDQETLRIGSDGSITMSGNITMKGGSIDWGNVTKPSYTASDVGALATNSPMLTNISATGIYTGTLYANQIFAGTLTGFTIQTTVNGKKRGAYIRGADGDMLFYYDDNELLRFYNDLNGYVFRVPTGRYLQIGSSTSGYTGSVSFGGNVDFSSATVTGLNNVVAKFG